MALIDSEGFGMSAVPADYQTYGILSFDTGLGGSSGIFPTAPFGDNCFYVAQNGGVIMSRRLPQPVPAFFYGARHIFSGGMNILTFYDEFLTSQIQVGFGNPNGLTLGDTGDGSVAVRRGGDQYGSGGTRIGLTPLVVLCNSATWYYLEVGAVIDAVAGSVIVRINGVPVLTVTGVNTKNSGVSGNVASWSWRTGNGGPGAIAHHYFCDATGGVPWNGFLGDMRVQTMFPTADDTVQFTPNGLSTNHANGASVPPVPATNFNSDTIVGHQDTFVMASVSMQPIYGVHVKPLLYKSDAGARSGASVLKSGATTDVGATTMLSVIPAQIKKMYQVDPNTGIAWTLAGVNAARPGYKVMA